MKRLPWLLADSPFPPLESAWQEPPGLLAAGGDLSAARLLQAYRLGIFPWFSPGEPILWWSPDPRMVLIPSALHITRSLAKVLRNRPHEVRFDTAFAAVMQACAGTPRRGQRGTWIVPEIEAAYGRLFELGYAHSIETWVDGQLVGGLYGVAIGRMFYGESMFSWQPDASKIALHALCRFLVDHDFPLIDCQMHTPHLARMGAQLLPRQQFATEVARLVQLPGLPGRWSANAQRLA